MIKLTEILYEENRYKKETGESLPRWKELLQKYEAEGGYYVHFSNVPRVGLYIINRFHTPVGFYAYPLNFNKMSNFAVDRPYAIVFKIKPEARILDLESYSKQDYDRDVKKLEYKYKLTPTLIDSWEQEAKKTYPAGYIWNLTRKISLDNPQISEGTEKDKYNKRLKNYKKSLTPAEKHKEHIGNILGSYEPKQPAERGGGATAKWTNIFYKDLGYDGVVDNCESIIHGSESCQAVFFNTNVIKVIDIIHLTEKIRKKDELSTPSNNFSEKDLSWQDLSGKTSLNKIYFKSNLSNTDLNTSYFKNCNFEKANLIGTNINSSHIEYCNFKNAVLENSDLQMCNLISVNLSFANLKGCDLSHSDFERCKLNGADLTGTTLISSTFARTDFHGVDLSGLDLRSVSFNDCVYDDDTKFPAGFDPRKKGLNLEHPEKIKF